MQKLNGVRDRADGQILVLFAGGLILLILVVGLVVDGGMAFLNRRDAQNTADLAALAGTKVVADLYVKGSSPVTVYDAIDASAQGNNCEGASAATPCTWTAEFVGINQNSLGAVTAGAAPPSGTYGVRVNVNRVPRTFFLGVIAQSSWAISTRATALTYQSQQVAPAGAMLPIGWRAPDNFTYNQVYQMTDGALDVPGNFGWLSWTGSSATNILNGWVCTPSNPQLTLPQYVDGNTGASNSSTIRDCLQHYIDQKIPVLIPIVGEANPPSACPGGPVTGNGSNAEYCVIGVVAVILESINSDSNVAIKNIKGFFQQVYAFQPGVVPAGAGASPPQPNSKFYYLGLVQ